MQTNSSLKRLIIGACMLSACMPMLTSCQESLRERFEREAKDFTKKQCPKQEYGDLIVLDSLVFHKDGNDDFTYCYTVTADSIMLGELEANLANLRLAMLKEVRSSVDLRHMKEAGLNIVYAYYLAGTTDRICEFRFTKEDYR